MFLTLLQVVFLLLLLKGLSKGCRERARNTRQRMGRLQSQDIEEAFPPATLGNLTKSYKITLLDHIDQDFRGPDHFQPKDFSTFASLEVEKRQ